MDRINKILQDEEYVGYLEKIEELEKTREFCRHNITHFLDVCRIAWILNLEQQAGLEKEMIYAAGLLHDIGRGEQYETGEDHALASARLCKGILSRCGFTLEESLSIQSAIAEHRSKKQNGKLSELLYKADKMSRNCLYCKAAKDCKKMKGGGPFQGLSPKGTI